MVSIRKYLDMHGPSTPMPSKTPGSAVLAGLCSRILDHITAYVLTGEAGSDPKAGFEQVKARLGAQTSGEEAARVEDSVRAVLAGHAAHQRENAQRIAVETQHIVGVLNNALMVMSGGSQRSVSRLQHIQESLQRTSLIRDAQGLRASLADAMTLIREEATREQEHSARDLASVESDVIKVREHIAANPVRRLPGRGEAIEALPDTFSALQPGLSLYAVAFSFDNIRAIVQRYGTEPVDELFFQVIRERIQPVAAANTSWRWSPSCVVSIFALPCDLAHLQQELAELCRAPLVYRMSLGNRTAVLKVAVSHLVAACEPPETLISQIDKFSGTRAGDAA